jgi:hypothetical protein
MDLCNFLSLFIVSFLEKPGQYNSSISNSTALLVSLDSNEEVMSSGRLEDSKSCGYEGNQ